ncbi:hypothetical protein [Methanobrevibacter sp.]|nr:hypothetical protein [Methanobrevibacter sp.]MEE1334922.1 hypothetical protein [Methanobrevibacter sp.]
MISKSPRIAAQSGVCLKAIIPTIVTSTIPNADQWHMQLLLVLFLGSC